MENLESFRPYLNLVLAYLCGSIPFGVILTKFLGHGNLQKMGSGNIGATNVVRTQGKALGFLTFFLDFLKGVLPYGFLRTGNPKFDSILLAMPVVGHIFPIWLKFNGGKGFATYLGVLLGFNFYIFDGFLTSNFVFNLLFHSIIVLSTILTWMMMLKITKTVGISSVVASISSLVFFYYINNSWSLGYVYEFYALIALVALIVIKHHSNIRNFFQR